MADGCDGGVYGGVLGSVWSFHSHSPLSLLLIPFPVPYLFIPTLSYLLGNRERLVERIGRWGT